MKLCLVLVPLLWLLAALPCLAQDAQPTWLDTLADNIYETGIGRDQILSVEQPRYIDIPNANLFMDPEDIVFLYESPRGPIIYPREILVWRQIVNDAEGKEPFSITHDPVTGTLVGYSGVVGPYKTGFGVFGPLLNNNLILYDRATLSLWPQLLGQAMEGRLKEERLTPFTLLWTTWAKASARHPKARVLTRPTTGRYAYGRDPYGSYLRPGTYYQNEQIVYPLIYPLDKRLPPKEPVLGLHSGEYSVAVPLREIERLGAVNFYLDLRPLAALYDRGLGDARVFERQDWGKALTFFVHENGEFYDQETHSTWNAQGEAILGPLSGTRLKEIPRYRAMWFAWAAMNQGTVLIPDPRDSAESLGEATPAPGVPMPDPMDGLAQGPGQQP